MAKRSPQENWLLPKSFDELVSGPAFDASRIRLPSLRIPLLSQEKEEEMIQPFSTWKPQFMRIGFEHVPNYPLRSGRWGDEETRYAFRLMYDLFTGRIRTSYRRYIRDVVCQKVHTSRIRVFKKFKGHKLLTRCRTLLEEDVVQDDLEMKWREMNLPKRFNELQQEAEQTDCQILRYKFLEKVSESVYQESFQQEI